MNKNLQQDWSWNYSLFNFNFLWRNCSSINDLLHKKCIHLHLINANTLILLCKSVFLVFQFFQQKFKFSLITKVRAGAMIVYSPAKAGSISQHSPAICCLRADSHRARWSPFEVYSPHWYPRWPINGHVCLGILFIERVNNNNDVFAFNTISTNFYAISNCLKEVCKWLVIPSQVLIV